MTVDQPGGEQQAAKDNVYIGHKALANKDKANSVIQPIKRGVIQKYEDAYCIWNHILGEELAVPKAYQVLVAENPINKKQNRIALAEVFFEKLNAESLAIMNGACLSLFSTGKTKGLLVEIGEGASYTVPIFEGFALQHAALTNENAGEDITRALIAGLDEYKKSLNETMLEVGKDIKEKMCSVPLDYEAAVRRIHTCR